MPACRQATISCAPAMVAATFMKACAPSWRNASHNGPGAKTRTAAAAFDGSSSAGRHPGRLAASRSGIQAPRSRISFQRRGSWIPGVQLSALKRFLVEAGHAFVIIGDGGELLAADQRVDIVERQAAAAFV